MMNIISLKKKEKYFLDNKFFIVKKGKIITKNILENGKLIINEQHLTAGDIIGNFFYFLRNVKIIVPDIEIEVEALDDTILEELNIDENEIKKSPFIRSLLNLLLKKLLLSFFYQVYDSKGYILAILRLYSLDNVFINKKEINYKNLNISKSQFYLALSKLKEEQYIVEKGKILELNLSKIDEYLACLGERSIS